MLASVALLLSGCDRGRPASLTDEQRIVRAVLVLLGKDNRPVCVDRSAKGDSLLTYRAMLRAPRASRDGLFWHQPEPLRPQPALTDRQIARDELHGDRTRLREPGSPLPKLPMPDQLLNNEAAQRLSMLLDAQSAVAIGSDWAPAGVSARWWPFNRIRADCQPNYILMAPVQDGNVGFIGVTADHWGTIYAVRRKGADWSVVGRWSDWLY